MRRRILVRSGINAAFSGLFLLPSEASQLAVPENKSLDWNIICCDDASRPVVMGLRSIMGTEGQIISTSGYYLPRDGGGGKFYWRSQANGLDNGGTLIRPHGSDKGAWTLIHSGCIDAAQFGVMPGDHCERALQRAICSADDYECLRMILPGRYRFRPAVINEKRKSYCVYKRKLKNFRMQFASGVTIYFSEEISSSFSVFLFEDVENVHLSGDAIFHMEVRGSAAQRVNFESLKLRTTSGGYSAKCSVKKLRFKINGQLTDKWFALYGVYARGDPAGRMFDGFEATELHFCPGSSGRLIQMLAVNRGIASNNYFEAIGGRYFGGSINHTRCIRMLSASNLAEIAGNRISSGSMEGQVYGIKVGGQGVTSHFSPRNILITNNKLQISNSGTRRNVAIFIGDSKNVLVVNNIVELGNSRADGEIAAFELAISKEARAIERRIENVVIRANLIRNDRIAYLVVTRKLSAGLIQNIRFEENGLLGNAMGISDGASVFSRE